MHVPILVFEKKNLVSISNLSVVLKGLVKWMYMSCSQMACLCCHGDLRLHTSDKVHLLVEAHLINELTHYWDELVPLEWSPYLLETCRCTPPVLRGWSLVINIQSPTLISFPPACCGLFQCRCTMMSLLTHIKGGACLNLGALFTGLSMRKLHGGL